MIRIEKIEKDTSREETDEAEWAFWTRFSHWKSFSLGAGKGGVVAEREDGLQLILEGNEAEEDQGTPTGQIRVAWVVIAPGVALGDPETFLNVVDYPTLEDVLPQVDRRWPCDKEEALRREVIGTAREGAGAALRRLTLVDVERALRQFKAHLARLEKLGEVYDVKEHVSGEGRFIENYHAASDLLRLLSEGCGPLPPQPQARATGGVTR